MRIVIVGVDLPGRTFTSEGVALADVHVGVQVGREPELLVPGDAAGARWEVDVRLVPGEGVRPDFRGAAVHGRRGDRFLYLTWGNVGDDGSFDMFRRAKLMLDRIDPVLVEDAERLGRPLVATVTMRDACGAPRCARVDPPDIAWALG